MSAFNNMVYKTRDRNWGGTASTVACEPYISGYSYIQWRLPGALQQYFSDELLAADVGGTNDQTITYRSQEENNEILEAAMMSVTPPGGTINKVQFQGLGGVEWAVPGSIDYGDSISIRYTEFSGLPITRIHRAWVRAIRDNKIGLTGFCGSTGGVSHDGQHVYNKSSYSATLLYWTTKPDGITVEHAAAYSGVFPTKDPLDSFNGDITAIDKLEIDIDYNVDMIWNEDWVYKMAADEAKIRSNGAKEKTLWSREGFRYAEQSPSMWTDTRSTL